MINKKGVALVIANSAYITQPKLKSCKKDGEDMRGALERLNFDVFFAENQNRAELFNIISEFLKNADLLNTFTADGLNKLLHEAEEIMEGWTDTNE